MRLPPLFLLLACGGSATPPAHELPSQPSASAAPPPVDAGAAAPIVRYDDLGIRFAVPAGFRVMGDAELEARIRASASVKLQADLRKHASEKKGIPLLALSREGLSVTLSVVVVPADATPAELIAQQEKTMTAALKDFQVTSPAAAVTLDGVPGVVMSARSEGHSMMVRLYVRRGAVDAGADASTIATLLTAVWSDKNAPYDLGTTLDGLHFAASGAL